MESPLTRHPPRCDWRRRARGACPLGALLSATACISAEQLEQALAEKDAGRARRSARSSSRAAGSTPDDGRANARRAARARVHRPDDGSRSTRAAELLPEKYARRYEALPVRFLRDGLVLVAVADPTNVLASDELGSHSDVNVRLAVSAAADVASGDQAAIHSEIASTSRACEARKQAPTRRRAQHRRRARPRSTPSTSSISRAIEDGASDLHFEPQATASVVRARIDGVMRAGHDDLGSHTSRRSRAA